MNSFINQRYFEDEYVELDDYWKYVYSDKFDMSEYADEVMKELEGVSDEEYDAIKGE